MPRLPSLTPHKISKLLEKRGFMLDRVKGSHHVYYHPQTKWRVVIPFHKRSVKGNIGRDP